ALLLVECALELRDLLDLRGVELAGLERRRAAERRHDQEHERERTTRAKEHGRSSRFDPRRAGRDVHEAAPEWRSIQPIAPAARITSGSGTFFQRTRTSSVAAPIAIVGRSNSARRPRTNAAPAIAPVAAAVTPSTNAWTRTFCAMRRK